jgi:hypothetical protein
VRPYLEADAKTGELVEACALSPPDEDGYYMVAIRRSLDTLDFEYELRRRPSSQEIL